MSAPSMRWRLIKASAILLAIASVVVGVSSWVGFELSELLSWMFGG